jgi:hypothetical protein
MPEYFINVNKVEELQTIRDRNELESLFIKARRTIIQGGQVVLVRQQPSGETYRFDAFNTEEGPGKIPGPHS